MTNSAYSWSWILFINHDHIWSDTAFVFSLIIWPALFQKSSRAGKDPFSCWYQDHWGDDSMFHDLEQNWIPLLHQMDLICLLDKNTVLIFLILFLVYCIGLGLESLHMWHQYSKTWSCWCPYQNRNLWSFFLKTTINRNLTHKIQIINYKIFVSCTEAI